jgi:serine/threonine protein kinase
MEQTITSNLESSNEQNNSLIFGNYEAVKAIGKGKFAIVYRAHRIGDDQVVALKRISVDMMNDKAREKTLKEVRLLQSLDHPNIIHYMDSFINDNDLIIIYEWAAAGDLKRQIRKAQEKGVGFEERVIWKYFSQIANAIQHMHERRIMHRDLKPANIFLTLDGTIKVGDLGLSREFSEHTHQAHSKVGTPLYMSPEVINGNGYEFKSDIWSLGCLLYELAVLKSPFKSEGINLYSLLNKISSGDYQPIPDNYSEELRNLAHAMISTNPQDRPDIVNICDVAQKMRSFTSSDKGGGKLKRSYSRSEDTMMSNTGGGSGGNDKNNNNNNEGEGRTGTGTGIAENKTIAPSIRNPNKVEQEQDQDQDEEGEGRERGRDRDRGEKEWRGTPTPTSDRMERRTRTPSEGEGDERGAEEKDRDRGREGRASSSNNKNNRYDNGIGIGSDHKREMAQTPPSSSSSAALHHNPNNPNNPSPRLVGPSPSNPFSKQLSPPPLSASRSSSNPNIHNNNNNPNNPNSQFQAVLPFDDNNQEQQEREREEQAKKPSDGVYRRSKPPRPESGSGSGSGANKRPPSGQQQTTTNNNSSSQSNQRRMSSQQQDQQFDDEPSTPVTPGTPASQHKERAHSASSVSNHLAAALESLSPAFAAMDFLYTKLIILDYPMTDPRLVSSNNKNKNNKKDKNNNKNNNSNNSNIDNSLPTSQRARGRLLPIHFACDLQLFSSPSPSSGTSGAGIAGHEPGFQFLQFRRMAEVAVWLCCEKIGGKSAEIAGRIDLDTSNSVTISKQLLLAAQVN